ncbi:monocarboxylate transporter 14-like isoform X1 [Penaeus japonicus]|uniref:monocarboxylate transporter 14-like isoform X1 n=1 Tax=Penaeus japonicus TaxID=27405 RepID=UPI001C716993|nr:monocarboxylate transporter 14-like isoform X1 [Penaeus japonicus]
MAPQTTLMEGGAESSQAGKRSHVQDSEGLLDPRRQSLGKAQVAEFHVLETGSDPSLPATLGKHRHARSPDVDRGWAWVVFVAAYLYFFVSSGMYYSFSVFFVELLNTFGESRGKTGWVYSTNSAVHMFSGPIAGWVVMRWGPRVAVMLGGLLAGLGNLMTAFAPSLDVVFFTHGFVNALGTSLNFSGWVVGLSRFFEQRHALAVGLAMSGSGCGVFFLGPLMETFVRELGWRGAMLICAGLSLNLCVFGSTIYTKLRPPLAESNAPSESVELVVDQMSIPDKEMEDLLVESEEIFDYDDVGDSQEKWRGSKPLPDTLAMPSLVAAGSIWSLAESRRENTRHNRLRNMVLSAKKQLGSNRSNDCASKIEDRENAMGEMRRLFCSPTFWLLEASCFLSFLATTTVFAVFLDWTKWAGLSAAFSQALAGSGAGDMVGRMLAGAFMGCSIPPLLLFSAIQLLLGLTIGSAALASTHGELIAAMVGFGIACGLQSVLYALMPSQMSSGVGVARVLGYLLLVTGAGALSGPPIAGALVDLTNSYTSVLILCAAAPAGAAALNLAAYFTSRFSSTSIMNTKSSSSTNTKSSSTTISNLTSDELLGASTSQNIYKKESDV